MLTTIGRAPTRPTRGQRVRLLLLLALLLALPTVSAVGTPAADPPRPPGTPDTPPPPPGPAPALPPLPADGVQAPGQPTIPSPFPPGPGPAGPGPGSTGLPSIGAPDATDPSAPAPGPAPWQVFHELRTAYALGDGELIRIVPAPFPAVRATWLTAFARRPLDEPQVLLWQGGRLEVYRRLARPGDGGRPIYQLLGQLFNPAGQTVVDDEGLLSGASLAADVVVRGDVWDEARALPQLATALRRELKLSVRLSVKEVERPHVVASGTFAAPVLPGTTIELPVAIYGKEPPPAGTPERASTIDNFLQELGSYVGLTVVNEVAGSMNAMGGPAGAPHPGGPTGPPGGGPVPGGPGGLPNFPGAMPPPGGVSGPPGVPVGMVPGMPMPGGGPAIRIVVRGDRHREKASAEAVLRRVAEQTGLSLRIAPRRVQALVVERSE